MKRMFLKIFQLVFILIGLVSLTTPSQAAMNLSVMPREGGRDIRLGRVDKGSLNQSEVRFRVTVSGEEQYQIYQRMVEPLTNTRGESVDRDVVLATALDGSNGSGTLYLQMSEPLGYGDQLIYTSSQDGQSDSFNIVYTIDETLISQFGEFRGRVLFSIRPIGSGSQDEVILPISFEAVNRYTLKTNTSGGLDRVVLNSLSSSQNTGFVQLTFEGNGQRPYQISQEWSQPLLSSENMIFPKEALTLQVKTLGMNSLGFESAQIMPDKKVLLASGFQDEAQLDVEWQLDVTKIIDLPAGVYRGRLQYEVDRDGEIEMIPIDFEVEVTPVFKLSVTYPPGGGSFDNLLPNSPPQVRELWLNVETNLSKPYIVSQDVTSPLANQEGGEIGSGMFTVMEEVSQESTGQVEHSEFVAVRQGDSVLYTSNAAGDPAQFKVIYKLIPFQGMKPGDYRTSIIYSLGEL